MKFLPIKIQIKISQKIAYSYLIAIGTALIGTTIGLVVGDNYQNQARQLSKQAIQADALSNQLEIAVWEVRSHPQRLTTVLGDSIWFDFEAKKFRDDTANVQNLSTQLATFIRQNPSVYSINDAKFLELIQDYDQTTQSFVKLIESIWQQLQPADLKTSEIAAARQQLATLTATHTGAQLQLQFEQLTEQLDQHQRTLQTQKLVADQALDRAERLRLLIIVSSMIISTILAIVLARLTSYTIIRPIHNLTQFAEKITQTSNFDSQIPVTTQDEIGSLTRSFNHLIQSIGQYTYDLNASRTTLEQRTQTLTATLAELEQAQLQLIQTEKMSALGQMVAGIAHEINNPIGFIYGNLIYVDQYTKNLLTLLDVYQHHYPHPPPSLQAALDDAELDFVTEDLAKILKSMQSGSQRIQTIVVSLRNFSRLDESDLKTVDIHEGIDSTLMLLHHRLQSTPNSQAIEIIKNYGQLPLVDCYPSDLNQVFLNILINALDVLEDSPQSSGTIWISTQVIADRFVQIAIANNGAEIPETIRSRIFDPFFTTKPVGSGTGLGLSISYQIIAEKHRGKLYCDSITHGKTTFYIEIPIRSAVANALT